jgi:predicted NBD/HSP70 family sugar kinase
VSTEILVQAGRALGAVSAVLVSGLNPSLVLVDAGLETIDDPYMTAFRETVLARSLPAAAQRLRFAISSLGNSAGLVGAAFVVDELLSAPYIGRWVDA